MHKLRVFLADDHAVVREGLKSLVNSQHDMEVCGEAADGENAWNRLPQTQAAVAVVDVSMPKLNGAELTRRISRDLPNVKVLALTVHEDKAYLRQLLEAGASGYMLKRAAPEELIGAIRTVADGGIYLDPSLAGKVVGRFVGRHAGKTTLPATDLSDREAEVVVLVARGYTNKEIAGQLDISVKTVETYKCRISEKLGFSSRADIVRYAIHQGWLQGVN